MFKFKKKLGIVALVMTIFMVATEGEACANYFEEKDEVVVYSI